MNNSKVLALKYRPKVFKDLIGQEIVAETIFNSISSDKIPNAFLFHGIRGTGKTSIARIIAKALNCEKGVENLCKDKFCSNCKEIINASHLDVIEQDCATATGIDSVRDLIEFCKYPPTSGKYKVLILDEIQAMSKAGAQSLLKILEEPPSYVLFIFCTTEIKKILVTMLSRCTRFDLSRVNSKTLFNYIKNITIKENGKISDEALKLICKCSEGSVRDALSLLDRAILSTKENSELDLQTAQKIFGHFDKSQLILLLERIIKGDEEGCLKIYRSSFKAGVDPSSFLDDFLEILYYAKNIHSLKETGSNFDLNDQEFKLLIDLSNTTNNQTLFMFWQFAIKTIKELYLVSNQNIAVEMFLLRLLYLKNFQDKEVVNDQSLKNIQIKTAKEERGINDSKKTIDQIKNMIQKEEITSDKKNLNEINSFNELIEVCTKNKEMGLKYDLETNVNLISFENKRIEISFNEKLNKDFVKVLSQKLLEWTSQRWIITLSKNQGNFSKKEERDIKKNKIKDDFKNTDDYKKIMSVFKDAKLNDLE